MCQAWHLITSEEPPQLFRSLESKFAKPEACATDSTPHNRLKNAIEQLRVERTSFKNMRIHLTDLSTLQSIIDSAYVEMQHNSSMVITNEDEESVSSIPLEELYERNKPSLSSFNSSSTFIPTDRIDDRQECNSISELVRGLFAEVFYMEISELDCTIPFEEMGTDSLNSMAIVGRLRDVGFKITVYQFWQSSTIQGLERFLITL